MTEANTLPENSENSPKVPSQLVPFVPGDPRINRKGRPKTVDAIRKLAQVIADEEIDYKGETFSKIEMILRDWASSRVFEKQLAFVQYAFGKVPDQVFSDGRDVQIVVSWDKVVNGPHGS